MRHKVIYQRAREAVEKGLGRSLPEPWWQFLVDQGDAEEVERHLDGDTWIDADCIEAAVRKVRAAQQAARATESSAGQAGQYVTEATPVPKGDVRAMRRLALSVLCAREAGDRDDVRWFRATHLSTGLLAWKGVDDWITRRAQEEGLPRRYVRLPLPHGVEVRLSPDGRIVFEPPLDPEGIPPDIGVNVEFRMLAYGTPDCSWVKRVPVACPGVLAGLRQTSVSLAADYRWSEDQAVVFLLTGITPLVSDLSITKRINVLRPASVRVTLTIDPALSPTDVARAYARVRRSMYVRRFRAQSTKHLALAMFAAEERAEGRSWEEVRNRWNQEQASEYKCGYYAHTRNFVRDCIKAQKSLLGPPVAERIGFGDPGPSTAARSPDADGDNFSL